MVQFHGIGPHDFFINLQGLDAIHIDAYPAYFQGSGIIGENHLVARFDTQKPKRAFKYIALGVRSPTGSGDQFGPARQRPGCHQEIFHQLFFTHFKDGSIPVAG